MIYFAVFFLIILIGLLGVTIINLVFREKIHDNSLSETLVTVLIPARNEADKIGNLLGDIEKQTHPNLEVFVYNDRSEDNTEAVVKQFAEKNSKVHLINGREFPDIWLGKPHACHRLSEYGNGQYLLFLDADVRLHPELITRSLNYLKAEQLALLSVFPKQRMLTFGEKLTVPLMHFILLTLLPLVLVRKSPYASLSAANGQFMFFERGTYNKYKPHEHAKRTTAEDIKIAGYYKNNKLPISCLTGTDLITCRMYGSYRQAVSGFSKNIVLFFGGSYLAAITYWAVLFAGFIPALFASKTLFIIHAVLLILIRILSSITARQNALINSLLFIPQMFSMAHILIDSFRKNIEWKGRKI